MDADRDAGDHTRVRRYDISKGDYTTAGGIVIGVDGRQSALSSDLCVCECMRHPLLNVEAMRATFELSAPS